MEYSNKYLKDFLYVFISPTEYAWDPEVVDLFKMPINPSQFYEISKIYVYLRCFLKKFYVLWFLSSFNQSAQIVF